MAIFKNTAVTSEVRGTAGGLTFRLHRGRQMAYTKPHCRRSRRTSQLARIAAFSQISARWRGTLTSTQRSGWANYARDLTQQFPSEQSAPITGRLAYIQHNILRRVAALAYQDTAPAVATTNKPRVPSLAAWGTTSVTLYWAGDPLLTGESALASFTKPFSRAVTNPRTWFREHFVQAGPYSGYSIWTFSIPYRSGATAQLHIRILTATGRTSLPYVYQRTLA